MLSNSGVTVDLFTVPAELIDDDSVRKFVADAIATSLHAESRVVEFKRERSGLNVVRTVAAMANTDGGLVFVGVDEANPDSPIVGVPAAEVDSIVGQLRAHIPTAMPEVIPVRLTDSPTNVVVVLRIDVDRVDVPVVLDGRILLRVPGSNVGARRDEIVSLVQRDASTSLSAGYGQLSPDVGNIRMWDDSEPTPAEIRVHARFVLPRHATTRAWLGTPLIEGLRAVLEDGPVPSRLRTQWVRSHEWTPAGWQVVETGALRVRLRSEPNPSVHRGRPVFSGSAILTLAGRRLDTLVSTRTTPRDDDADLVLGDVSALHEVVLGGLVAVVAAGRSAMQGLGVDFGAPLPALTGWLGGSIGLASLELTQSWLRYGERASRSDWRTSETQPAGLSVEDLDVVARQWLVPLLFELGVAGFEDDVDGLELPNWASAL